MNVRGIYRHAVGMTSSAAEKARIAALRVLFALDYQRQTEEDEALAALRALGDDGRHLRQAVALAALGATDEQVDEFVARLAHGEDDR